MKWPFSTKQHQAEIDYAHDQALEFDNQLKHQAEVDQAHGEALEFNKQLSNWTLQDSEAFDILTGGVVSTAGANVSETTAMRISSVYASVRIISSGIGALTAKVYKRTNDGRESQDDHPFYSLLNVSPHHRWVATAMWERAISTMLLHGDGLIAIERIGSRPAAFRPMPRLHTDIRLINGRLKYVCNPPDEDAFALDQDDVIHIPNLGFDGVSSLSAIGNYAKDTFGLAITADQYASLFFANGAKPDFALKTDKDLKQSSIDNLRRTWMQKHGGMGRHLPAVLTGGLDVKELTMNAVDSQLLETRKFSVIDIARTFGVPAHMIGENEKTSSWGSGIENLGIAFVKYTLRPHLKRIEQELTRKLFPRGSEFFIEFNVDGLMRGDSKAQADFFGRALGGSSGPGFMSQNEVRKTLNLKPMEADSANELTAWTMSNQQKAASDESTDDE